MSHIKPLFIFGLRTFIIHFIQIYYFITLDLLLLVFIINYIFFLKDMEELYAQFKLHNESKNIFKAARTPAVFFALAVVFYILSGVFGLVGMYSLANLANLIMGISLITLITWSYVR